MQSGARYGKVVVSAERMVSLYWCVLSHGLAEQHGESYVLGWLSDQCSVPANLEGEYGQRNHAIMQCAVADDE